MRNVVFVVLFTVCHAAATTVTVANALGSAALISLPQTMSKVIGTILACPLLLPCILLDPDGGRFPAWFRASSIFLNSALWAVLALAVVAGVKRHRGNNGK